MSLKQIAEFFQLTPAEFLNSAIGIATLFVGVASVVFTRQESKISKQLDLQESKISKQLDLYEKRLHIYEKSKKILQMIIKSPKKICDNDFNEFYASVAEAEFLFSHEITEYINEIVTKGLELKLLKEKIADHNNRIQQQDYKHEESIIKCGELEIWFQNQLKDKILSQKFKKYLNMDMIK